ncbi:MAG: hypothetical protein AAB664_01845, partial [Patescibacteria group bacterium]
FVVENSTVHPTIHINSFLTSGTGIIPKITIISQNAGNVTVEIPTSTTIVSDDPTWDGVFETPTFTTVTLPTASAGTVSTVSLAIQMGFAGRKLSLNKAARIFFPNQAGKRVGFSIEGEPLTEITAVCSDDVQFVGDSLQTDGDCKINKGSDLIVWTKHFTSFATYDVSIVSPTFSGGGSGTAVGDIPMVLPSIQTESNPKELVLFPTPSMKTKQTKEILIPTIESKKTVIFSQPDPEKKHEITVTEKGKEILAVVYDPLLKPPMIESSTHTTAYRYYRTNDVEVSFSSASVGVKFDQYFYTISTLPTVSLSELQISSIDGKVQAVLPDGIYYVHVAGRFGKSISGIRTRKIMIDATPPVFVSIDLQTKARAWTKSTHTLNVNVFDKTAGLAYYKLVAPYGTEVSVMDQIPLRYLHKGDQTYKIQAVDIAGNVQTRTIVIHVEREHVFLTMKRIWNAWMNRIGLKK